MNPNTKLFYNGKQLRTRGGRFSSFKSFCRKVWRWTKITTGAAFVGSLLVVIGITIGASNKAEAIFPASATVVDSHETLQTLEDKLAAVVHQGESNGREMKDGEIYSVFDPSQAMRARCMQANTVRPVDCESYGPYQEKLGTIQFYAKQVYGHEVTQLEAMQIANDNDKAKDFFLKCSIKVEGCVYNWTAAQKNRAVVDVLVPLIRSLSK